MRRAVQPELLDTLPPDSPEARQSRLDLQRLNRLLGHPPRLARMIASLLPTHPDAPWQVAELGVGDGDLTARIWMRLPRPPAGSQLVMVDQTAMIERAAIASLSARGWQVETVVADAFAWLEEQTEATLGVIYANLFIHHFDSGALVELLRLIASKAGAFATLEPRRCQHSRLGARCLGLLGSHPVTRHDAYRSVLAGFAGRELSAAWPDSEGWILQEGRSGLFSHRFSACRRPEQ